MQGGDMQGGDSHIDYERLVSDAMREAMRNVLRSVLTDIAKTGLPGDHHFYISFSTTAPGVSLSKRLMEKYPEEMTIVLQHRFWDLIVHGDRFEVKLQFNSIPEKLVVPFEAIRVFVDPSVRFGHQFDDGEADTADGDAVSPAVRGTIRGGSGRTPGQRTTDKRRMSAVRKKSDRDVDSVEMPSLNNGTTANVAEDKPRSTGPSILGQASGQSASVEPLITSNTDAKAVDSDQPASAPANEPGKVISLDKFRKKPG